MALSAISMNSALANKEFVLSLHHKLHVSTCINKPNDVHKHNQSIIKDKDYCQIEIIKGLTDKGLFQYLTKLMGPQEGTYLYATQFHSLR